MVTRQKAKPTKLPRKPFTVLSDDLVIIEDEVEYRPHDGETVTFRGRMTVADYLNAIGLAQFNASDTAAMGPLFEDTIARLANRIVSWTWTGEFGEKLPPPTPEILRSLSFEELVWLIGKANGKRSDEESKNASTPST